MLQVSAAAPYGVTTRRSVHLISVLLAVRCRGWSWRPCLHFTRLLFVDFAHALSQ